MIKIKKVAVLLTVSLTIVSIVSFPRISVTDDSPNKEGHTLFYPTETNHDLRKMDAKFVRQQGVIYFPPYTTVSRTIYARVYPETQTTRKSQGPDLLSNQCPLEEPTPRARPPD